MKGAIKALRAVVERNPLDVVAWDHLALALRGNGDNKGARKAYGQAANLHFRIFLKEFAELGQAPDTASITRLKTLHKETTESVSNYLALGPSGDEKRIWNEVLKRLPDQGKALQLAEDALAQGKVFQWPEEPTLKVRILSKPEPGYTSEAHNNQVEGTVVLQAVFSSEGIIKDIKVLRPMPYGLTEKAIEAAHKIIFFPATVAGRPVSMYYRIEYNFKLY
jgi:TonB family protein